MKKYHYTILLSLLGTLCFADSQSLSDREIQSLYDGAKEMEMLNSAMERGIQLHNQQQAQIVSEPQVIKETIVEENGTIPGFQEKEHEFYYEETIPNYQNTKVDIKAEGNKVIITTKTSHKQERKKVNGVDIVQSSSSSRTELELPYNADINKVEKSYNDGVIKITIPKKREFLER